MPLLVVILLYFKEHDHYFNSINPLVLYVTAPRIKYLVQEIKS